MRIDLEDLGFDRGAHILVQRALAASSEGEVVELSGRDPHLVLHATTWCRAEGHACEVVASRATGLQRVRIRGGGAAGARAHGAERSRPVRAGRGSELLARPPATWGLAARGALIEAGAAAPPAFDRHSSPQARPPRAGLPPAGAGP